MTSVQERLQAALEGRYAVSDMLGEGGMATVYRATDLRHRRPVAIKVLRPELSSAIGADRFLREIEIAAALQHPRILPLYDSGAADGLLYYIMPLVEGESLRRLIEREGQLPLDTALRIARDVAAALGYAHARGIVHRDIKPDNILLAAGEAVVADFGIARALDAAGAPRLTSTGVSLGTPVYMSPEQVAADREVDGRSDLYSLGCVLYEMVAGRPPFVGPTAQSVLQQHMLAPPPRVSSIRATAPPGVDAAIERALAKAPADRFATAADFAAALDRPMTATTAMVTTVGLRRQRLLRAGLAGLAVLIAMAVLTRRRATKLDLDPNLLAVAPFDVLAPGEEVWHEGMADRLARGLDDAGPLRTVSPTVVVRRWAGKADPVSADALGRSTGAGLVVFGAIERAGADSLRLHAALRDVAAGRTVAEREVRGTSERMDLLADSTTVALLNELSRVRTIGAVRAVSLGSHSLPAIKAFLRAEQFVRRTLWDSVEYYAVRAVQLDSSFALARRRVGQARGWQGLPPIPEGTRAWAFNRGLSVRDSLMLVADEVADRIDLFSQSDSNVTRARRLRATLTTLAERHPEDPETWFALGEMAAHTPHLTVTRRRALEIWQRSIELDPSFGPSYLHPVPQALEVFGLDSARRLADAYAALDSAGVQKDGEAVGMRLVAAILHAAPAPLPDFERRIASLANWALVFAHDNLVRWPDSTEYAIRLLRHVVEHPEGAEPGQYPPQLARSLLAFALAFRGHLEQAVQLGSTLSPSTASRLWTDAVLAGGPSAALARAAPAPLAIARSFERAPAWAVLGDTANLVALVKQMAVELRQRDTLGVELKSYRWAAASAWLALAQGDSAKALAGFLALSDSSCVRCVPERLLRALLLVASHQDERASALLDGDLTYVSNLSEPLEVLWILERARVNERLGRPTSARQAYQFVADVWRHADPILQPYVVEARTALGRLGPTGADTGR